MPSTVKLAASGLWPYRFPAVASISLQMAAVAAESIALLAVGSMLALSLENEPSEENSGVLRYPEQILEIAGADLSITTMFILILIALGLKAVLQTSAIFIGNAIWTHFQQKYTSDLSIAYASADWNHLASQKSSRTLNLMISEVTRHL